MSNDQLAKCTVKLPIGNLHAGDLFVLADNVMRAKIDFNIFAAADEIAHKPEVDFMDFLIELDLVDSLPEDTTPVIAEWQALTQEQQFERIFEPAEGFPRVHCLRHMEKYLPGAEKVLNFAQYLTIACHLGFKLYPDMTIYDRIINMPDELRANKQYLTDFVIQINSAKVSKKELDTLTEHGYIVNGIFPREQGGLGFAYTKQLHAVEGFDFNLFACMANMPVQVLGAMLNGIVDLHKAGENIFEVSSGHGKLRNGDSLRLKCIEASYEAAEAHGLDLFTGDQEGRLVQVLIPDENNLFPDEVGYNHERLNQPLCIKLN